MSALHLGLYADDQGRESVSLQALDDPVVSGIRGFRLVRELPLPEDPKAVRILVTLLEHADATGGGTALRAALSEWFDVVRESVLGPMTVVP